MVSFLSQRCVLFLTDEGVNVFTCSASSVRLIQHISWKQPNFSESLAELIARDAGGKSVVLLNDVADQIYRRERLPSVPYFDRASVLQRKLNVTFPTYPIRSAKEIKEPRGLDTKKESTTGKLFLFCALPASDPLSKVIEATRLSLAPVGGLCLLPIESTDLVVRLSSKLRRLKPAESASPWTVFIAQHSNGGLRQIVVRNGDLTLTRITPISDPDRDPGQWALEVLQELKSTITYLGRHTYKPTDGLEIILLAPRKNQTIFADILDVPGNLHTLSVTEAGGHLGIRFDREMDERWADPLHAAWIAKKGRLSLPLISNDLNNIAIPRFAAGVVRNLLLLASIGALGYAGYEANGYFKAYEELVQARETRTKLYAELEAEIERKKSLGIDVKLVQAVLDARDAAVAQSFDPLPLLLRVSKVLPANMRVEEMTMAYNPPPPDPAAPQGTPPDPLSKAMGTFTTTFKFLFPEDLKPEHGNKRVEDLRAALQQELQSDYTVVLTKKVADLSYAGSFETEFGVGKNVTGVKDASAEIQITSVVKSAASDVVGQVLQ